MTTLKFGKYCGCDIKDVPTPYLEFLIVASEKTVAECAQELERRAAVEEADQDWALRIISAGFRELSKKNHPDLIGGDGEAMKAINAAVESLREAIRK